MTRKLYRPLVTFRWFIADKDNSPDFPCFDFDFLTRSPLGISELIDELVYRALGKQSAGFDNGKLTLTSAEPRDDIRLALEDYLSDEDDSLDALFVRSHLGRRRLHRTLHSLTKKRDEFTNWKGLVAIYDCIDPREEVSDFSDVDAQFEILFRLDKQEKFSGLRVVTHFAGRYHYVPVESPYKDTLSKMSEITGVDYSNGKSQFSKLVNQKIQSYKGWTLAV